MFVRTVFMSLLASGVDSAMCSGGNPLRDIFGAPVSCMQGMMTPPPVPLPTDSITYMSMAAAGDLYEIQSGQIALAKGSSIDTRNFGQMLINDHTQTTATLNSAAASVGLLPPPPVLNLMQQQMINELQLASPASFDAIFWKQQLTAHKMALDLHSNYASFGDTPAFRAAAASAIPIVQMHLSTATTKVSMMGGTCPPNYWCNSDAMSAVCCPSEMYMPSVSIASPYFSASFAPLYRPLYTPTYASVGF